MAEVSPFCYYLFGDETWSENEKLKESKVAWRLACLLALLLYPQIPKTQRLYLIILKTQKIPQ